MALPGKAQLWQQWFNVYRTINSSVPLIASNLAAQFLNMISKQQLSKAVDGKVVIGWQENAYIDNKMMLKWWKESFLKEVDTHGG